MRHHAPSLRSQIRTANFLAIRISTSTDVFFGPPGPATSYINSRVSVYSPSRSLLLSNRIVTVPGWPGFALPDDGSTSTALWGVGETLQLTCPLPVTVSTAPSVAVPMRYPMPKSPLFSTSTDKVAFFGGPGGPGGGPGGPGGGFGGPCERTPVENAKIAVTMMLPVRTAVLVRMAPPPWLHRRRDAKVRSSVSRLQEF